MVANCMCRNLHCQSGIRLFVFQQNKHVFRFHFIYNWQFTFVSAYSALLYKPRYQQFYTGFQTQPHVLDQPRLIGILPR